MDRIRPHVLLVEDDVELRTALAMLLQSDGNVVTPEEDHPVVLFSHETIGDG